MHCSKSVMQAISICQVFLHCLLIYECMHVINIMIRISITSIGFNHNLAGFRKKKMEFINDIEPWLALVEKNFINLSSSHESYSFSSSRQRHHAVTIPGAPITTNYRLRQKSRFGSIPTLPFSLRLIFLASA